MQVGLDLITLMKLPRSREVASEEGSGVAGAEPSGHPDIGKSARRIATAWTAPSPMTVGNDDGGLITAVGIPASCRVILNCRIPVEGRTIAYAACGPAEFRALVGH
jgi:hypothetical protein